jgi:hypothetical protein
VLHSPPTEYYKNIPRTNGTLFCSINTFVLRIFHLFRPFKKETSFCDLVFVFFFSVYANYLLIVFVYCAWLWFGNRIHLSKNFVQIPASLISVITVSTVFLIITVQGRGQ